MSDAVIKQLRHLLLDSRKGDNYSCKLFSGMFANLLLEHQSFCYIIDSEIHSVVFDGKHTWDLSLGVVFRNYKYPSSNIPEPEIIEDFNYCFNDILFSKYYTQEALTRAKNNLLIKEIKKLGVYNGTKEN